jgi:hypothetical protein
MRKIESLVEAYLTAERALVAAVDAAGGAVPLPDGRTVTVGRAEFDALLGERRKRAWVIIRKPAQARCRRRPYDPTPPAVETACPSPRAHLCGLVSPASRSEISPLAPRPATARRNTR